MKLAKPVGKASISASSLEDRFENIEVDSLDLLIIGMYLCDAFDIPEAVGKDMRPETLLEMREFLVGKTPMQSIDVDAALAVMS